MLFWKYLEDFPPPLVRILARRSRGRIKTVPLTDEEIAIASGLPLWRVQEIMFTHSWKDVLIGEAHAFFRGCNFDPTNYEQRHRANMYALRGRYQYWKTSPLFESHFIPLYQTLKEALHERIKPVQ